MNGKGRRQEYARSRAGGTATPTALPGLLDRAHRRTTLGIVVLTSLVAFESLAVATAMPYAATHFDALAWYALAFASTLAASAVGIAIAGAWSDARGAATPTWFAIATLMLGLLLSGLAQDFWLLLVGRVVQGLGVGAIGVTLYVLAATAYPQRLHGRVLSSMSTAWVVPALVGPAVSGVIVSSVGWRWVFLLAALASIPAAALLAPALRSANNGSGKSVIHGTTIAWATLAATGLAIAHLSAHGGPAGIQTLALGGGLALLAMGARRLLPSGTGRLARGLPSVIAVRALAAAAFFSAEAFVPLLLIERYGYSATGAGMSLTGAAVGWALGAQCYSRLSCAERPPEGTLHLGAALMLGGLGVILAVLVLRLAPVLVVLAWSMMGLGMGLQRPALGVLVIRFSPPDAIGDGASALQMGDAIATATALAVTGAAFAALHTPAPGLAYLVVFAVSVALLVLVLIGAGRVMPAARPEPSAGPSATATGGSPTRA